MIVSNQPEVETLSIRTLGGLAIQLGREPRTATSSLPSNQTRVHFRTRTIEALLVYLACRQRPVSRDVLAEMLWPERTQEQARSNLRVAIHRLREQLDPYVAVSRQHLALNPSAAVAVDAAQFEAHLAAGELAAATALYRGDFLEGFYLDDSPEFEQWVLLERERLHMQALAAWQQIIAQQVAAGGTDAAINSARHLLVLDPLHEPTHRQLMRLLAQADQRGAALAQYETCRQLLASELAVPPDEVTTTLYEQIRAGAIVNRPEASPVTTGRTAASATKSSLPQQPTPLIGRSAELAQIDALLANPDCRLLTLLGAGGIGKTRLAVAAAARQEGSFADGVCFVALAGVGAPEFVAGAIAEGLGLQVGGSEPQAELLAYLRPLELLLVLDNFEHLLGAADTVAAMLQCAPRVKVLVPSRARLHLREEWLFPITGLSLTDGAAGEAGQLFLHSAQRVQPGFTGKGQEAAIAAICRQVEGLPLALELASSWVRLMPCAEIARQIQANLDFLAVDVRNLPLRHRSLRALFDHSWLLLTPMEQEVLMRLSVFAGGWTADESAQVAGATLTLLVGLADKSLVQAAGTGRFNLHELVRQYAAEKLATGGDVVTLRRRHYTAYLRLLRRADGHLRRQDAAAWIARLLPEQDNLRAALQWTLDEERYEDAAWLMVAVHYFWFLSGHRYEGATWFTRLLPHLRQLPPDLHLATLICYYSFAHETEDSQPMEHTRSELLRLIESSSQPSLQAAAWFFLALHTADISQSTDKLAQAVAVARIANASPTLGAEFSAMADSDFALGSILGEYAAHLIEQGKFVQAGPYALEGLELFRARGDYQGMADCLGYLGRSALLQGNLAQARLYLLEVMALAAANDFAVMRCRWQSLLALVILYGGDHKEARRLLDENLHFATELKNKFYLANTCAYLAEAALWEADYDQAGQWLTQNLAYNPDVQSIALFQLDRLLMAARLSAGQQQYMRSALLFGLEAHLRQHLGYELIAPLRTQADAALVAVRAALGDNIFIEAFNRGRQLEFGATFAPFLLPG
jgi:predicted ATPase/DNA-binding SARP family transcriptional activator